jgi:YD repeat-containing protein
MRKIVASLGISFVLAFVGVSPAFAGVNVNNGNFYVAYTDIYLPTSGLNVEITRTYNSRSNYVRGWFGVGWSSELEGYLTFDKEVVNYSEGGGGNIVKFVKQGKEWVNGVFGQQSIAQTKTGWVLKSAQVKDFHFDNRGRIQKISDRNKNYIELVWGSDNRISLIRDNFNNQIAVKWAEFGGSPRIVSLESGDTKARYDYSKTGDLTRSVGMDGVPYEYAFDDEHNLTKIAYQDGSSQELGYDKRKDWVTKFKDRDGIVATYEYFADKLDPESKFGTTVTRTFPTGAEREVSRFWYEFRKRADGTKYNHRAVTWVRNTVTESIFTECCGTPLAISQWPGNPKASSDPAQWTVVSGEKKTTLFEYFPNGLLKKKVAPDGNVTTLAYDPKHGKVSSVVRAGRRVDYNYDGRGNLAWAFDAAENRRMDLTYDIKGRITIVKEHQKEGPRDVVRNVYFRYNADGKPVEIKEKSGSFEGVIRVSYAANGEVSAILNGNGRGLASEREIESARRVAATFQNLLEIVQPAGVSLTPEG